MFAIKQMRERAKMTQPEVAKILGVRVGRYGDWERETREINLREAIKLADIFHCTLDELAGIAKPALSEDENVIVAAYRATDDGNRERLLDVARLDLERAERSASQKRVCSA